MTRPQQQETTDALEEMRALGDEVESHQERLRQLIANGEATPEVIAQEIAETFMPLLGDTLRIAENAFLQEREDAEATFAEFDDRIGDLEEDIGPGGDESQLTPEDAGLIMALLQWTRSAIEESAQRAQAEGASEAQLGEVQTLQADLERAIARVAEITMEPEPDAPKAPNNGRAARTTPDEV